MTVKRTTEKDSVPKKMGTDTRGEQVARLALQSASPAVTRYDLTRRKHHVLASDDLIIRPFTHI